MGEKMQKEGKGAGFCEKFVCEGMEYEWVRRKSEDVEIGWKKKEKKAGLGQDSCTIGNSGQIRLTKDEEKEEE